MSPLECAKHRHNFFPFIALRRRDVNIEPVVRAPTDQNGWLVSLAEQITCVIIELSIIIMWYRKRMRLTANQSFQVASGFMVVVVDILLNAVLYQLHYHKTCRMPHPPSVSDKM